MDNLNILFTMAVKARDNAYAPYSNFKVGAAIKANSGNFYSGCNVENVSYPCGTCAEAGAISAMIAAGDTIIDEILIVADTSSIFPCGNCLQKIAEFTTENSIVYSADLNQNIHKFKLRDLLPNKFNSDEVKNA